LDQLYEKRWESTDRAMGCQLSVQDILKNLIDGSKCPERVGENPTALTRLSVFPHFARFYSIPHLNTVRPSVSIEAFYLV